MRRVGLIVILTLSAVGLWRPQAAAQVFDHIEMRPTATAVEIHLVFNTPIVYEFHRPEQNRSDFIQIHLVLPEVDSSTRLRRERRSSPPQERIPRFSLTFPFQETRRTKSVALKFEQPVSFKLLGVQGRNRLVIALPLVEGKSPSPMPVLKFPSTQRPSSPHPDRQDSTPTNPQPEKKHRFLDRIEVFSGESEVKIHIKFKIRAIYLYHFPLQATDSLKVHLLFPTLPQRLGATPETMASPPNDVLPPFTVTFPDQETRSTKRLTVQFAEPLLCQVKSRASGDGLVISIPHQSETQRVTKQDVTPSSSRSVEGTFDSSSLGSKKSAKTLFEQGQAALMAKDYQQATNMFNALLNLPPNPYSQDAQELVGLARERSGEIQKAKIEYELYLKLYPEGEGATRVRQRLAVLQQEHSLVAKPKSLKKKTIKQVHETSVYGNLSQYYYGGHSWIDTTTIDGGVTTTTNQNTTDQSSLVSSLNLTGRYRRNQYDTQLIFRGSDTMDFLVNGGDRNEQRLRRAYVKHEDEALAYRVQVGRQPGNAGGILGTFDGGFAHYDITPEFGVNLVGGFPEPSSLHSGIHLDTDKYFVGSSVDIQLANQDWSGNTYFINQMVQGIVDRQGLGGELRYFADGLSAFSLIDVDVSYRTLNIAMLNGSWLTQWGSTVTLLIDHRKTPSLQTTNGLIGSSATSVREALQSISEEELREQAKGLTADSDLVLLGLTHPITATWQLGGDIRFNHTSSTKAVGNQPAVPASGNIWTYTVQATGTDIFLHNHTLTVIGSYINNPTYQGQSLLLNSLWASGGTWQIDSSLNVYHQEDEAGTMLFRVTPSFRVSYRWQENMLFEVEGGIEQVRSDGATQQDITLRDFFSFGYVWEH